MKIVLLLKFIYECMWGFDDVDYQWKPYLSNQNNGMSHLIAYRIEAGEVKFFK